MRNDTNRPRTNAHESTEGVPAHTPTPWKVNYREIQDTSRHEIVLARTIETAITVSLRGKMETARVSHEEACANAAFIVRAVNSHELMERALENCIQQIEYLQEKFRPTGTGNATLVLARSALAAVKGEA